MTTQRKIPSNKNRTDLNTYKNLLHLTDEQKEIIVGTCLGDLNIRQIGQFSRLVFEQKNKDCCAAAIRCKQLRSTYFIYLTNLSLLHEPLLKNANKDAQK